VGKEACGTVGNGGGSRGLSSGGSPEQDTKSFSTRQGRTSSHAGKFQEGWEVASGLAIGLLRG